MGNTYTKQEIIPEMFLTTGPKPDHQFIFKPRNTLDEANISDISTISVEDKLIKTYKLGAKIGRGTFGSVQEAHLISNPQLSFAIKTIKKSNKKKEAKFLENELSVLKSLDHPNLVRLYETYEDESNLYLVMELCKGGNLMEYIARNRRKQIPESDIKIIMKQILYAVNHMHTLGIAHRDLKPQNILFHTKNNVNTLKVADFGLSKNFKSLMKMESTLGTPSYVAPEVLTDTYDEKCDCWSIGIILFQMISGDVPFADSNTQELLTKIIEAEFKLKGKKWSNISVEGKDLVGRLLTKDPKKRISCARALEHTWFSRHQYLDPPTPRIVKMLTQYKTPSLFKKEIVKVIINFMNQKDLEEINQAFHYFDKEKDGDITLEEFQQSLKALGHNLSINQIEKLMSQIRLAKSTNQAITYSDFIAATIDKEVYLKRDRLWGAFKYFDVHNKNVITKEDIKLAFLKMGTYKTSSEVDEVLKEVRDNEKISFEKFVEIVNFDESENPIPSDEGITPNVPLR